jgi:hypothetical protein
VLATPLATGLRKRRLGFGETRTIKVRVPKLGAPVFSGAPQTRAVLVEITYWSCGASVHFRAGTTEPTHGDQRDVLHGSGLSKFIATTPEQTR